MIVDSRPTHASAAPTPACHNHDAHPTSAPTPEIDAPIMHLERVTIIGAGPAGVAAALQLERFGWKPLLIERASVGGLLVNAERVENYPGFPCGISGPDFVRLLQEHLSRAAVAITHDEVVALTHVAGCFQVQTRRGQHRSRWVVIASGTKPITFAENLVPPEARGRICYEVAPLRARRGKDIVVVGAGDAAFDYALTLAQHNDVTILNRGERRKCLPTLWERASANPRITYLSRTSITHITPNADASLSLACTTPTGPLDLRVDDLLGALGREPRLDFVAPELQAALAEHLDSGFLHLIGDVRNGPFRQAAIAVGEGILAAMKIHDHGKDTLP